MSVKELSSMTDDDGDIELTDVEDVEVSGLSSGSDSWTLDELIPVTLPITCKVPQRIVIFMRSVERVMQMQGLGSMEFGVFLKGSFRGGELLVDGESHFIPKQKVTGVTIDFQEDPPDSGFNGVIHRHPTGCKGFSGTDAQHINRNFEFSLLYEGNEIIKGIINIVAQDGTRIQLPLDIEVVYPVFAIGNEDVISEKIQKDTSMMSSSKSARDFRQQGLAGLLTDGDDDNGCLPFGDRQPISNSDGDDREVDDDGDLYVCSHCGEPNIIDEFPYICDSCEMALDGESDCEYVVDITDLDPDTQKAALEKLAEHREEIEEEEDE